MIHQVRIGVLAQDVTFLVICIRPHTETGHYICVYVVWPQYLLILGRSSPISGLPAKSGQNVSVLSWQVCYGCSVEEGCLEFSELIVSPHYETIGGDVLSSILTQYKDTTCSSAHDTIRYGDTTSLNALPLCEKLGLVRSSNPSLSRVELRLQTVKEPLED